MYITIMKNEFNLNGINYAYLFKVNKHNKFKKKIVISKPIELEVKLTEGMRIYPFWPLCRKSTRLFELHSDIPKEMYNTYDIVFNNLCHHGRI